MSPDRSVTYVSGLYPATLSPLTRGEGTIEVPSPRVSGEKVPEGRMRGSRRQARKKSFALQFAQQRTAVAELERAHADAAGRDHVLDQIVDQDGMMRQRPDHLQRAAEDLRIGLGHAEAVREDETVVPLEESRVLPRDQLRVHLVRVREERHPVRFAYALEHFLDPRHRAVEEVAPDVVKVADAAAISGAVAEELVELPERDGAALHVAIAAGVLEQIDQLIARDRCLGA